MKALMFSRMDKRAKQAVKLKKKGFSFFFWTGKFLNGKVAYCISYDPLKEEKIK